MLLPLAPRAQGAMGRLSATTRGGRGGREVVVVVERWLIRLLDRVHVGEARRTFGLWPVVNQRRSMSRRHTSLLIERAFKLKAVTGTTSMHSHRRKVSALYFFTCFGQSQAIMMHCSSSLASET